GQLSGVVCSEAASASSRPLRSPMAMVRWLAYPAAWARTADACSCTVGVVVVAVMDPPRSAPRRRSERSAPAGRSIRRRCAGLDVLVVVEHVLGVVFGFHLGEPLVVGVAV